MSKTSKQVLAKRDQTIADIEALAKVAETEGRELTAEEVAKRDGLAREAGKLEAKAVRRKAEEKAEKRRKAAESRNEFGLGTQLAEAVFGGSVRVKSSERTYRRGGPVHYMTDLVRRASGDMAATARLLRHAQEMAIDTQEAQARIDAGSAKPWDAYHVRQLRAGMGAAGLNEYEAQYRALSTAAGSGGEFVPPAYLTEQYVPYARPGRVFADACNKQDLPPGTMSINIPKVASGTSVDTQGTGNPRSQNVTASDTTLTTEYVTFPVVTIAGQQKLSLQLLERSPIAFDDVTFKDLALALAQKVDFKCIDGAGSGDITGALNTASIAVITWAAGSETATITVKQFYAKMAQAKGKVASVRFLPATHAFFTPNRWEWVEQQLDKNTRPLVVPSSNGVFQAVQEAPDPAVAEGVTGGNLLGLRAVQDFNVPANLGETTTEDTIVVAKMDDLYLYESPIVARALPQTYGNELSVLLQVYEYGAFTAARYPTSICQIKGTALKTPVFG